jgi:hypothetical protein
MIVPATRAPRANQLSEIRQSNQSENRIVLASIVACHLFEIDTIEIFEGGAHCLQT